MESKSESRETREFAAEVKFLLAPNTGTEVERWASRWLSPDSHGSQYRVTSLYFDTADGRVYRRDGSYARAKYRIRRYGDSERVFLERKLRSNKVVVKRRTFVDIEDIPLLDVPQADREWRCGHWFHQRLQARSLRPVWQISYLRSAFELTTTLGTIRLTLDRHLSAQSIDSIEFRDPSANVPLFDNGEMILELKFRRAMPELFRDLLGEFGLQQQSVSKFRLAGAALRQTANAGAEESAVVCA